MIIHKNEELNPLCDLDTHIHNQLDKIVSDLDEKISKWSAGINKVYLLRFYDENNWEHLQEIYLDIEVARKRFIELMKELFKDDMEASRVSKDMDWNLVERINTNDFVFTKDRYENCRYMRWSEWEQKEKYKYPQNTWAAYNPNYYDDLTLIEIEVWRQTILDNNKEENGSNTNG